MFVNCSSKINGVLRIVLYMKENMLEKVLNYFKKSLKKKVNKYNIRIDDINICLDYDKFFNDWKIYSLDKNEKSIKLINFIYNNRSKF
tara:strand:- start:139 stop:402 length:264 start_codon:yes stop_codon:yes gene_type:complete